MSRRHGRNKTRSASQVRADELDDAMNDVMDHIRDGYDTTLGPKIQHLRQYQQEAHWPTETYLESKGFIYEGYLFMMPANHARASFTVCSNQHGNYI
jgi:hypothetical protein